jgi:hypothetical protein
MPLGMFGACTLTNCGSKCDHDAHCWVGYGAWTRLGAITDLGTQFLRVTTKRPWLGKFVCKLTQTLQAAEWELGILVGGSYSSSGHVRCVLVAMVGSATILSILFGTTQPSGYPLGYNCTIW